MTKKYIHYPRKSVFALYYVKEKVIYYNLNFQGKTKLYLFIR